MKKSWKMRFLNGKPCSWDGDVYDEEYCEFYFFASDCEIDSRCSKEYTVIGNIFDNPKLLKGE